jgi:phosphate transport system protein
MSQATHILGSFESALQSLRSDVLAMGGLTERNLRNATLGLLQRDVELCNVAIADDDEIDQLEKEIDRAGVELLLRFQPVASDLRAIVAAMKLGKDLERVADQTVNIAKKARKLTQQPTLEETALLEPMFTEATALFKDSMRAYADGDVDLAISLKQRDKKVDELNLQLSDYMTERMAKHADRISDYLNLIFIARHLERIGDHAKNIGEDVVYAVAAEDIRHNKSNAA